MDRLPIELGPISNDEYDPVPPSVVVREAERRAWVAIDENARRTGMSRRSFLRSACGAATVLLTLDACTKEALRDQPTPRTPGGTFSITPEATLDPSAAAETIGTGEFVFDVQSHLLQFDLDEPVDTFWGQNFPQAQCGDPDPRACFSVERYLEAIFLDSDTTMAVLSAVPIVAAPDDHPLSASVMDEARAMVDAACGQGRLLLHGQATPNLGDLEDTLGSMEELVGRYRVAAWKVYTHTPSPGWRLDDGDPAGAQVGTALIDRALELGVPRICVHKGLSGGSDWASPADIGPAAVAHPDVDLVVYHSGYETTVIEGPYDPSAPGAGVDRLLASLEASDVGPNRNVYAELGSTWFNLMRDPTQAAHVLGKLLLHVGEDNLLWGTDSIWYGSPQGQIDAFRSFEISTELQEQHGYPALTPAIKRKVLGLNAARLYGVEPETVTCTVSRADLATLRGGRW